MSSAEDTNPNHRALAVLAANLTRMNEEIAQNGTLSAHSPKCPGCKRPLTHGKHYVPPYKLITCPHCGCHYQVVVVVTAYITMRAGGNPACPDLR